MVKGNWRQLPFAFGGPTGYLFSMLFQQLFESTSSTFTYLLADPVSREAVLIDSVQETFDRDLKLIRDLELKLLYALETHIHADHITAAGPIADKTGAKTAMSAASTAKGVDVFLKDKSKIKFGAYELTALATPGHTHTCMSYYINGKVFTGDTLLIRGCGRTDFQEGSAETLYRSVHEKLFSLPEDTVVYPAHDYKGFTSSTIGIEKKLNPRLGGGRSAAEFVEIMKNLKLDPPKKIDTAVPANLNFGRS